MRRQRFSMRKIQDVLRLRFAAHLSERQIAAIVGYSRSAVHQCLGRAAAAKITWPLPPDCDEAVLQARLYAESHAVPARIALPDPAQLHHALQRPGVTRQLLWREYLAANPDGLKYTAFCNHYRLWLANQASRCAGKVLPMNCRMSD